MRNILIAAAIYLGLIVFSESSVLAEVNFLRDENAYCSMVDAGGDFVKVSADWRCEGLGSQFQYGWSDNAYCHIFTADQYRSFVRVTEDWKCEVMDDPRFEFALDHNAACVVIKSGTGLFVRRAPEWRCLFLDSRFAYRWSHNGLCTVVRGESGNFVRYSDPADCGVLDNRFRYAWSSLAKCTVASQSGDFVRYADDKFCDGFSRHFGYEVDDRGSCNVVRATDGVFVRTAKVEKCKDLRSVRYAWSESGRCQLRKASGQYLRDAQNWECGDLVGSLVYRWSQNSYCEIAHSDSGMMVRAASERKCRDVEKHFRYQWGYNGRCEAVSVDDGRFLRVASDWRCAGEDLTFRWDTEGRCQAWLLTDGEDQWLDLVKDHFCQEDPRTEVQEVPLRFKSYIRRLKLKESALSDPRALRGRGITEALWVDSRRRVMGRELAHDTQSSPAGYYSRTGGHGFDTSYSIEGSTTFYRVGEAAGGGYSWRTSDGATLTRTGSGVVVVDSLGRLWLDNGSSLSQL